MIWDFWCEYVKVIIGKMVDCKQVVNWLLLFFKIMLDYVFDNGWIKVNLVVGVKGYVKKIDGFYIWMEVEIVVFEVRYLLGSKVCLVLILFFYIVQCWSDVVVLGWVKINGRFMFVKQMKIGVELDFFMFLELLEVIVLLDRSKLIFFIIEFGKFFMFVGFGNWFCDCCNEVNFLQCLVYGFWKVVVWCMVEGGMSGDIIKVVIGYIDLKQVLVYIVVVNQVVFVEKGLKVIVGKKK